MYSKLEKLTTVLESFCGKINTYDLESGGFSSVKFQKNKMFKSTAAIDIISEYRGRW